MMPDIAICDPEVTMSMPAKITAETGMDALTHALEALASNRANYLSDILASQAAQDIMETLPVAYENGNDIKAREIMVTGIYGSWNCISRMYHLELYILWLIRSEEFSMYLMVWQMPLFCHISLDIMSRMKLQRSLCKNLQRD